MISAIITAWKEPKTVGKAIMSLSGQVGKNDEIIVIAPDKETLDKASKYRNKVKNLKILKDFGKGKPAALNLVVSKAKGDILVFTDGDVLVDGGGIKPLIDPFADSRVGAVSGRPVSADSMDNKFGFWAYMLTEVANEWRIKSQSSGKKLFCSGYLFAIRKNLFPKLPEELLSEDGYISHKVYDSGFNIEYSKKSKVYVKYPDNFSDWIVQKKRSTGGYSQIKNMLGKSVRSLAFESSGGFLFLKYIKSMKQLIWLFELFAARIYLWLLIYKGTNLRGQKSGSGWKRVESTK